MGKTFAERIISVKAGHSVQANDLAIVEVDAMMASDTTGPMAIKAFHDMGGVHIARPDRSVFVIDHAVPCPNEKVAALHALIRTFAREQGCLLFDQNCGVCHQIMLEQGIVKEGDLVLGADSHTCSYGAVGAFSTGVGSTDLGAALLTGKTWLRVPQTTKIVMTGMLPKGVFAKDVILRIIGDMTASGATYEAIEFCGEGFDAFSQEEAVTACNMVIEMGAKSGVFVRSLTKPELIPDEDALYSRVLTYRAEEMEPMVACPHRVDAVCTVEAKREQKIDMVYIGSCTNGKLSDIQVAADILRGKHIHSTVRLIICPASNRVLMSAMEKGYIQDLIQAGAVLSATGCSLCVGTLGGVPADGETVLSTTNRNFKGRMGNSKAFIYLASPATAAASALTGYITDPREVY